jgi:hypothetical protein
MVGLHSDKKISSLTQKLTLLQRFYCKVENVNDVKFSKNNKKLEKNFFFIFFILGTLCDVPGIQNKAKKK